MTYHELESSLSRSVPELHMARANASLLPSPHDPKQPLTPSWPLLRDSRTPPPSLGNSQEDASDSSGSPESQQLFSQLSFASTNLSSSPSDLSFEWIEAGNHSPTTLLLADQDDFVMFDEPVDLVSPAPANLFPPLP